MLSGHADADYIVGEITDRQLRAFDSKYAYEVLDADGNSVAQLWHQSDNVFRMFMSKGHFEQCRIALKKRFGHVRFERIEMPKGKKRGRLHALEYALTVPDEQMMLLALQDPRLMAA